VRSCDRNFRAEEMPEWRRSYWFMAGRHGGWCWERARAVLLSAATRSRRRTCRPIGMGSRGEYRNARSDALRPCADVVLMTRSMSRVLPLRSRIMPDLPKRRVPTTDISCRHDQVINGTWGGQVARESLNAGIRELGTGHWPFRSAPDVLADLLEDFAGPPAASR